MKSRILGLMALAVLCLVPTFTGAAQEVQPDVSFASPEEAIEHLAAALRKSDAPAALAAFGIEARVRDYSFVGTSERLNAISLPSATPPVKFGFYADLARRQFANEAATQLRNLAYSLLVPEGMPLDRTRGIEPNENAGAVASALEAALDPGRLVNLKLLHIGDPTLAEVANTEKYRNNIAGQLAVTGGDDLQERVMLYELDGRYFAGGITLVRYGDAWQVRRLASDFAGLSMGLLVRVDANGVPLP